MCRIFRLDGHLKVHAYVLYPTKYIDNLVSGHYGRHYIVITAYARHLQVINRITQVVHGNPDSSCPIKHDPQSLIMGQDLPTLLFANPKYKTRESIICLSIYNTHNRITSIFIFILQAETESGVIRSIFHMVPNSID